MDFKEQLKNCTIMLKLSQRSKPNKQLHKKHILSYIHKPDNLAWSQKMWCGHSFKSLCSFYRNLQRGDCETMFCLTVKHNYPFIFLVYSIPSIKS